MKLFPCLLCVLAAVPTAAVNKPLSSNGLRRVLSSARLLEDSRAQQGERAVEDYVQGYSMQFLNCVGDEAIQDVSEYANDDYTSGQYGVVFFRMCPNKYCSTDSSKRPICKEGYANFAISISSYISAYVQDQADIMQYDADWDMSKIGGCNAYNNNFGTYYVGPSCSADGSDINLALFEDYQCQHKSSTSFESISNGANLPYSNGGLIASGCLACADYGDDGAYDVRDICMDLYSLAPLKCESWPMMHYYWDAMTEIYRYGQDTTGCKKIELLSRKSASATSEVQSIVFLSLLVLISVGAGYYYTIWWKNSEYHRHRFYILGFRHI
jgi:hypothetical protein